MAKLMLTCPSTGKPAFTGEEGGRDDLEALAFSGHELLCPECRQTHEFSSRDTYIED